MRIAIDARMMGPMNTRGIGRYVEELIRAMLPLAPDDQFILLTRNPEASPFLGIPNVEHLKADIQWYSLREQLEMPRLLRQASADVVHVPHWNVPLRFSHPHLVITVHDLILLHQPKSAKASTRGPIVSSLKTFGHRLTLRHAIHQARVILSPTNFVTEDIKHFYPSSASKIVFTGEGLSPLPLPDLARVPTSPFLFYVGSAYPHKGLDLLLDGWKELALRHPHLFLVLAGQEDVFMARYVARVHQEQIPRVTFPGRVTDSELAGFLSQAQAFVFPSTHEGFGLPPIEALSMGCPVVSSDSSCLPEVLPKEGVFFFRTGDKNDMIRAVDALLSQLAQARAAAQTVRSLIKEKYQWSKVAERTLEAYQRAK